MKSLKVAGIPALLVLCIGIVADQDSAYSVEKATTKTGHFVQHAGKSVVHATKSGVKDTGRGTKAVANESVNGVEKAPETTGDGTKNAGNK